MGGQVGARTRNWVARYAASPIPLGGRRGDSLGMYSFGARDQIAGLAGRASDGLEVRLWWDPASDGVAVTVADAKTGPRLGAPVPDGEPPLDVFRHPFAYGAERGLELRRAAPGAHHPTAWAAP
jgi:hypothetical protein